MATQEDSETTDDGAREDVEFLVSSWNRHEVLKSVTRGTRTRNELREETDVSRVTLSRILSDLESKNWIDRTGDGYEATRLGTAMAEEVNRLLENLRTVNQLDDDLGWIQIDQFDFDLAHLQDASLIKPTWDDFAAQTRLLTDLVYESTAIRGIGTGMDREFMEALVDATVNGTLSSELILSPDVIDAINAEPEFTRLFRDFADADDGELYRYQGQKALMELGIHETEGPGDDPVMICGEYEDGAPPGTLESTNPAVRKWAESYFEARRAESHRLKAAVFTP